MTYELTTKLALLLSGLSLGILSTSIVYQLLLPSRSPKKSNDNTSDRNNKADKGNR